MKHIIFILLLISPFVVSAQYPAPTRSNASVQPIDVRHKAGLNEIVPVYNDTVQANLPYNIGNDSIGAIIFTKDANALWYRTKQKYWSLIGTGTGSGQLFAVGDSTATGTRYFNQKKNAFIYDSAGSHVIVAYDTFNHYFTKFYLDTTYTYLQVSSNDFNTFGSISVTKNNATVSASSPDSGHQVVVNNGNVTVRDLRNNPSKLVITGISTGTDTVFAPTQILVLQGDTVKSARYPSLSPTDTANLSYRIDTVGKIIYIDTTQYLRYNITDSVLYSIPVNGVFADGLISIGGINLLDSTLTILPNIVAVRNNATITLTSSASFIINSTSTGYYRTDLIYLDSNNVVQHIVGIEDTVITVPPPVPYKGIGIAIVNVHNGVINSTVIPTANNWLVGGQAISGDSSIGTLTNNGMLIKIGGVNRSIYPATGGFSLYGIGTTQMNAIPTPLAGTIVYNNDSLAYCYYNGSAWLKFGSGGGSGSVQRFGYPGEDVTGLQDRLFSFYGYKFQLYNGAGTGIFDDGTTLYQDSSEITLYAQSTGNTTENQLSIRKNEFYQYFVDGGKTWSIQNTGDQLSTSIRSDTGVNLHGIYIQRIGGLKFINYANRIFNFGASVLPGTYNIPISVNGTYADATGNITISAGGTITHAVDSVYRLTDSLLLIHYSPYNRTDTFSFRGGGAITAGGRFTTNGYAIFVDSTSSLYTVRADTTLLTTQARTTAGLALKQNVITTSGSTIVSTLNQTSFPFPSVPSSYTDYDIFVNGSKIEPITYFSNIAGAIVFTTGLAAGDRVQYVRRL